MNRTTERSTGVLRETATEKGEGNAMAGSTSLRSIRRPTNAGQAAVCTELTTIATRELAVTVR
jgi:hypothetical protein